MKCCDINALTLRTFINDMIYLREVFFFLLIQLLYGVGVCLKRFGIPTPSAERGVKVHRASALCWSAIQRSPPTTSPKGFRLHNSVLMDWAQKRCARDATLLPWPPDGVTAQSTGVRHA